MSDIFHTDDYQELHYTILRMEKETEVGPESIDLTKKLEQAYSLILGKEDDDDFDRG